MTSLRDVIMMRVKVSGKHCTSRRSAELIRFTTELPAAIKKTGHDISEVKQVIMGHLHLDHAGGLENFRNTDVKVWVHELELKHAFYSVLTKTDFGKLQPCSYTLNNDTP